MDCSATTIDIMKSNKFKQHLLLVAVVAAVLVRGSSATPQCAKGRPCPSNLCCSSAGYCGSSEYQCGTGCISGPCYSTASVRGSGAQCGRGRPCPSNLCCSGTGFCGSTTYQCGAGCISGPCVSETGSLGSSKSVESVLTAALFDELLPARKRDFYTYKSFIAAASSSTFEGFGTTGDVDTRKREVAAFFAHVEHETAGLSIIERAQSDVSKDFCYNMGNSSFFKCFPGKKYFSRGPMQLTWNYNYGSASDVVGSDLLANPELVSEDPVVSFKSALWVWMSGSTIKPSSHEVMVGTWSPSVHDVAANRRHGFGTTINILKGRLECGHESPKAEDRANLYLDAAKLLGVDPGEQLKCANMVPFF